MFGMPCVADLATKNYPTRGEGMRYQLRALSATDYTGDGKMLELEHLYDNQLCAANIEASTRIRDIDEEIRSRERAAVVNATLSDCLELPDLPNLKKHIYPNRVEAYKRGLLFELDTLRASGYGICYLAMGPERDWTGVWGTGGGSGTGPPEGIRPP